ncbi:MAG: phosphoenolpyruvate carboxykinase domain-containing protein, partial [Armatimonadetes bacterium]|nr:phosphoenolpyruvate carboxykinase domain-containing protein [Armatimonadota bacterium]
SFNWTFGVYMAAAIGSETTAAAAGLIGRVRRDPFAMLPFCGYHMGDYFTHWLQFGRELAEPPRIFVVNWFQTDEQGRFLWPGFGQNMRVLRWIVERVRGEAHAVESPIGWMPRYEDVDWSGLDFSPETFRRMMAVDREQWQAEILAQTELFNRLYDRLPKEFLHVKQLILSSIWRAPKHWEQFAERNVGL